MLHTVNKSPFEKNSLASCLRVIRPGGAVVLIEDGVYGALVGTDVAKRLQGMTSEIEIYALAPDLRARGMGEDDLIEGVELIDYRGFVRLAVRYEKILSWL